MERPIIPAYLYQFSRNLYARGTHIKKRVFPTPRRRFASSVHRHYPSLPVLQPARSQIQTPTRSAAAIHRSPHSRCPTEFPSRRLFSTSSSRREAGLPMKVSNPRKDEDGKDMLVGLTDRAASRLRQIMQTDQNPNLALRVTVESGGCHGFQYLMSLTDTSKISDSDDTIFEATGEGSPQNTAVEAAKEAAAGGSTGAGSPTHDNTSAESAVNARVVLDEPSLELLKGSKVDYTMELIGSQFKIVDNPAASSSCGCGTSFDIKG